MTTTHCPPPERLAAFAEGKLSETEAAPLLLHLEGCASCRADLRAANAAVHEEELEVKPPARMRTRTAWWIGLAAAAVLAGVFFLTPVLRRPSIARLAELAPRSARVVEPRLSGGFAWAPYRGVMRASDPAADAERLELAGAAGAVIKRAAGDPSAEAQHAAGLAYLLVEQPDQGVERLRTATERAPGNANAWSDLAAAQYAAALRLPNPALLPQALASADRALRIDAAHREALFNRALILERLGLTGPAREAWERYLAVDGTSAWAVEARARLAALPGANADLQFRETLPQLAAAAAAGDAPAIDSIVSRWREQSRAWGEAEFLGQWAEAAQRGDAAGAERALAIARALGTALRRQSGEALLADAVAAIDRADAATRATLAEAHVVYRRGRMAYGRQQPSAAEPELRRAALLFARAGSPMARMARQYAANTRYDQNDIAGARAELEALLAEEAGHPSYRASGALVRWQLSLCHTVEGDAEEALELLAEAAATMRRLDERNHLGFLEALLADALAVAGRPADSWAARIRSFEVLSAAGKDHSLLADLASAGTAERRAGRREAALALLAVEREIGREARNDVLLASTLTRMALLSAEVRDDAGAAGVVEEASDMAGRITDPAFRAMLAAHVELARGAALLRDDPRRASDSLGVALAAYREMGQRALEVDCHLLLARAAAQLRDPAAAAREIDAGLDVFARFGGPAEGGASQPGVLDSGSALAEEAIRLSLDRGDVALAFGYADRALRQVAGTELPPAAELAARVRSRLAGSGAALLELVALHGELVAFLVHADGVSVVRRPVARERLAELARRCAAGDGAAAEELYDLVIAPLSMPRDTRSLIVVAGSLLDDVPFAALRDRRSGRHLIEQLPVLMAESAASLRSADAAGAPARALAIALPAGAGAGSRNLAESAGEAGEVAASYADGVSLPPSTFTSFAAAARGADVIHVSGHTEGDGESGTAALFFAGPDGTRERVPWRSIASSSFPRLQVAVLAACDTLRAPRLAGARAPSLGGAFLSAGAANVIGTIRPIGDREARELFRAIHRELASGVAASEAVRRVQIAALAREPRAGVPAWSSIAILTREIPRHRT
ncbi:MAG TPA: CHAT domain-containing protein [Thermoanaerobaculia bacterium]